MWKNVEVGQLPQHRRAVLPQLPQNGLLSPPFPEKKIATALPAEAVHSARVFIAAIINEQGALQQLRSPRQLDDAAKAAIQSLTQWRFTPASLNGKPVAVKVLIGGVPQLIGSP